MRSLPLKYLLCPGVLATPFGYILTQLIAISSFILLPYLTLNANIFETKQIPSQLEKNYMENMNVIFEKDGIHSKENVRKINTCLDELWVHFHCDLPLRSHRESSKYSLTSLWLRLSLIFEYLQNQSDLKENQIEPGPSGTINNEVRGDIWYHVYFLLNHFPLPLIPLSASHETIPTKGIDEHSNLSSIQYMSHTIKCYFNVVSSFKDFQGQSMLAGIIRGTRVSNLWSLKYNFAGVESLWRLSLEIGRLEKLIFGSIMVADEVGGTILKSTEELNLSRCDKSSLKRFHQQLKIIPITHLLKEEYSTVDEAYEELITIRRDMKNQQYRSSRKREGQGDISTASMCPNNNMNLDYDTKSYMDKENSATLGGKWILLQLLLINSPFEKPFAEGNLRDETNGEKAKEISWGFIPQKLMLRPT